MRLQLLLRVSCALAVSVLALVVPGAPAGATVLAVPDSIDRTGGRDVTRELNDFFAGVPDGSVVAFEQAGEYRIEGTVQIVGHNDLTIEGAGSTLFATSEGDRTRSHVEVIGGSDIVIRELVVHGANPAAGVGEEAYQVQLEAQHGFELRGVRGVELDHVGVVDVYGDFVYLGKADDGAWTEQAWIHDSLFARNGRQGIAVVAGRDVVIERNGITDTRRATIDLEPNDPTGGAINIHILHNTVGPGRLLFLASQGNGPVNDVVVANNTLTGRALTVTVVPPPGTRRARFWITGNRSTFASPRSPIRFERVDGVVVWRNRQPVETGVAVKALDVCGLLVEENAFGLSVQPTDQTGPPCGDRLGQVAPLPPKLPNRERVGEPQATVPADTTPDTLGPDGQRPRESGDLSGDESWAGSIFVGLVAVSVGAIAVIRAWRRRQAETDVEAESVPDADDQPVAPRQ